MDLLTLLLLDDGDAPPASVPEVGQLRPGPNYFRTADGQLWSYKGVSQFLLFSRWLKGEDIDPQIVWSRLQGANVVRVLGMVGWSGSAFGPNTPNYWHELPRFIDHVGRYGLRVEFTVFADAQKMLPNRGEQRAHLDRVVQTIGSKPNVLIEICNEPWQNGVEPFELWPTHKPRPCPMAYGDYTATGTKVLDYLTAHTPRDAHAWSRKAKDLYEYREGPMGHPAGLHVPVVDDEPMGAAEASALAGRQRSNNADDFFWHHAVAHLFSAGSTFHSDAGLLAELPGRGGDVQRCADAVTRVWSLISPEWQGGRYIRSGMDDLPLAWTAEQFPEQTSRIYGMVLNGNRAMCVAVKPAESWTPRAINGWSILRTEGPRGTLVTLAR